VPSLSHPDTFYLAYPDKVAMQALLDPAPDATGNARTDTWIGAVGEHLAMRWGLATPDWVRRPQHDCLEQPDFMPPSPAMRDIVLAESPPAFRARGIFTFAEPLVRARWPRGVPFVEMPWGR
jgi:hypothetical protein